jgi:hypothetical protein
MYNFKKLGNPKHWEFYHDAFRRGQTQLLRYIKRKKCPATSKAKAAAGLKSEVVDLKTQRETLQHDLDTLTEQQAEMETQLSQILEENSDLRSELESTRQAHDTMRRCVDRIVSLVAGSLPDNDLAELHALVSMLPPAMPALPPLPSATIPAVRQREADTDAPLIDADVEPPRKRARLDCPIDRSMDEKQLLEPALPRVKEEASLLPDCAVWEPASQKLAFLGMPYGDLDIFRPIDADDCAVPCLPLYGRAGDARTVGEFLDTTPSKFLSDASTLFAGRGASPTLMGERRL